MADLPVLSRLGRYELLAELGQGSFGSVYRARDTVLGREVALKILHPALLSDPGFSKRFGNDARAAAQLNHPHIVSVYDLGEQGGRIYISMQLLPGGTLAERIERGGRLPFADAVQITAEISEALDYAHARGFVHRDVKPTNILFDERGAAVLTDFGLAQAAQGSTVVRSTWSGVVGTPAYIAPEVWEGAQAAPATDVYALGCVLYEMLTGTPMFQGDTPPAVMLSHFKPLRFPQAWPQGLPPEVQGILERALAQDVAQRYAGAGALAADLQAAAGRAADPLAGPYQALQAAMAAKEWPRAKELAAAILAKKRDYCDVGLLAAQVSQELARGVPGPAGVAGGEEAAIVGEPHRPLADAGAKRTRAKEAEVAGQAQRRQRQGRGRAVATGLAGLVLGLVLGMVLFWRVWPVKWTDAHTYDLAPEAKAAYVQLVAKAVKVDRDYAYAAGLLADWTSEEKQQAFADAASAYEDAGLLQKVQDVEDLGLILQVARGTPSYRPAPNALLERLRVPGLVFLLVVLALVLAALGWWGLSKWLKGRRGSRGA